MSVWENYFILVLLFRMSSFLGIIKKYRKIKASVSGTQLLLEIEIRFKKVHIRLLVSSGNYILFGFGKRVREKNKREKGKWDNF